MTGIKTRSGAKTLVTTNLPTGTGAITAANHRSVENTILDSAVLFGEGDPRVINMTTTTPPGSPTDRDAYVVGSGATGAWASQDNKIAIWDATISPDAWVFITPADGFAVWNLAEDQEYRYDAGASPDIWVAGGVKKFVFDAGTKSSGTYTPAAGDGQFQKFVNGGAFTLAPPADDCSLTLQGTNNASAGAITTSGFTKVIGDTLTTTNGDDFLFQITVVNGFSHLDVKALQ